MTNLGTERGEGGGCKVDREPHVPAQLKRLEQITSSVINLWGQVKIKIDPLCRAVDLEPKDPNAKTAVDGPGIAPLASEIRVNVRKLEGLASEMDKVLRIIET